MTARARLLPLRDQLAARRGKSARRLRARVVADVQPYQHQDGPGAPWKWLVAFGDDARLLRWMVGDA